jgi:hypothetical protein
MPRPGKILLCLVLVFVALGNVQAQNQATVTGHVIAEVIPVFSASETSQMNFGRFSPGPQGGEIILTPQSSVSVLGSVFVGQGMHNAASFYVSGDADATFSVTLPSAPVILNHVSTAKTMLVEDWNSYPAEGTGTGVLKGGFQTVYVGATLKVGTLNDNPIGIYTGTFELTFDFN